MNQYKKNKDRLLEIASNYGFSPQNLARKITEFEKAKREEAEELKGRLSEGGAYYDLPKASKKVYEDRLTYYQKFVDLTPFDVNKWDEYMVVITGYPGCAICYGPQTYVHPSRNLAGVVKNDHVLCTLKHSHTMLSVHFKHYIELGVFKDFDEVKEKAFKLCPHEHVYQHECSKCMEEAYDSAIPVA